MSRTRWRYHAGEKYRNRVTARATRGTIRLTWWDGGVAHSQPTGTHSIQRAIVMAEAMAAELKVARTPKHKTHEPEGVLIAIRQDLIRVATEGGYPRGYAPPIGRYTREGRFSVNRVRAAFHGYVRCNGKGNKPAREWMQAVRLFGLTPYMDRFWSTQRGALIDLREVALKCGHPGVMPSLREYDTHGKWSWTNLRRRFGGICWPELADQAGLTIAPERRAHSEKIRNRPPSTDKQNVEREAAA